MSVGVDFATSSENVAALKAAGVAFVCRYLSGGGDAKDITAAERDRLLGAGIGIVLVWETDGRTGPLVGNGAGDANAAVAEAERLGVPSGTCLYFAVDFDMQPSQLSIVRTYFARATSRCHVAGYRCGVYGGFAVVEGVADLVDLGWQTYAWSGGRWSSHAHLQQYANGAVLAGIGVDYDRNTAADFGQWGTTPKPQEITMGGRYRPGTHAEYHWPVINADKSVSHWYVNDRTDLSKGGGHDDLGGVAGGPASLDWNPDGTICTIEVIGSDGSSIVFNDWHGGKWGGWTPSNTKTLQIGVQGPKGDKGDPGPASPLAAFTATISPK